jgi:hypothetical protein
LVVVSNSSRVVRKLAVLNSEKVAAIVPGLGLNLRGRRRGRGLGDKRKYISCLRARNSVASTFRRVIRATKGATAPARAGEWAINKRGIS